MHALTEMLKKQVQENTKQPETEGIDYSDVEACRTYLQQNFPNIEPSAKEYFKGNLQAYKSAALRQAEEEKRYRQQQRIIEYKSPFTLRQMEDYALTVGNSMLAGKNKKFMLDQYNEKVFNLLCLYFTNDTRFEAEGFGGIPYSLNKGIWLQSSQPGTGKSFLLRCFYMNKRSCFGYKHTTELAGLFQRNGFPGVDPFIGTLPQQPSPINFYQQECGFMYDELFGEDKVNHMGSPMYISSHILNQLYDFGDKYKNKMYKFHCTSNADGSDIEAISGKRFRSRMVDMFNLIKLDGPDRRSI